MEGPLLELKVSDGWATGVKLLQDGSLLTTAVDPFVRRWSASGDLIASFEGHSKSVDTMALVPHVNRLLTGSVDGDLRLWDMETGGQVAVLSGHKKTVASVAVTPDGRLAASGSYDKTIRLWDLETAEELAVLKGHKNNVVSVKISPDGSLLVSGGIGPELRLWSLPDGGVLKTIDHAHEFAVIPAGFTPDGSQVITTGADDELAVWLLPAMQEVLRIPLGAVGTHAADVSPDGRLVAVTLDRAVRVIDLQTGETIDEQPFSVKGVYGVSFSADGTLLATATADSCLRTWRIATKR